MSGHFHQQLQKNYTLLLLLCLVITLSIFSSGLLLFRHSALREALKANAAAWQHEVTHIEAAAAHFLDTIRLSGIESASSSIEKFEQQMYIQDRSSLSTAKIQILDSHFHCIAANTPNIYYGMLYHLLETGNYNDHKLLLSIGRQNNTVLVKKIGAYYIVLFLDFSRLENRLAQHSHFGVLVNRHNTIAATNLELFKHELKFNHKDGYFSIGKDLYTIRSFELSADYRFIAFEKENNMMHVLVLTSVCTVCIMGILFGLGKIMTARLVRENTKELNLLLEKIEHISGSSQLICMQGNNEFTLIADKINKLLCNIDELHMKNEQLLYISIEREMKVLEASFNPHFIYNTLDAIKYLIFIDKKKSVQMIQLFSEVLRYSLNTHSRVLFDEDLYYIEQFLRLHIFRLEESFDYDVQVPSHFRQLMVPKLFLQPLIENSLKYGFKDKKRLHISIYGRETAAYYVFEVADSGAMLTEQEVAYIQKLITEKENPTGHIGLYMTARLVKLYFGEQSYLTFSSSITGTVCSIYVHKGDYKYV